MSLSRHHLDWSVLLVGLVCIAQCVQGDDEEVNARWRLAPPGAVAGPRVCPAWLDEYATWHKENRGKPDATYLMFGPCSATVHCTGLGDRIKSSFTLLRLAATYKKVLLLSWDHVLPLSKVLAPQAINWEYDSTLEAQLGNVTSEFDVGQTMTKNKLFADLVLGGQHTAAFRSAKFVRSQSVRDFLDHIGGIPDTDVETIGYAGLGRCFFRFLFEPTKLLKTLTDAAIENMYGATSAQYVAWHWRSGGLEGERILDRTMTTKIDGSSRMHQLMAATQCAHDMASLNALPALSESPMLLITDHNLIRRWVAAGELLHVVTPNVTAVHISKGRLATATDVMHTWIDIALLSRAKCLLMSYSGFSWLALFMGNSTCYMDLHMCLTGQKKHFKGFDVR